MNSHTTTNVINLPYVIDYSLIDCIDKHFNCSNAPELENIAFAKYSSKGNQQSSSSKIRIEDVVEADVDSHPIMILVKVVVANLSPETSEKNGNLNGPCCNQVVKSDRGP
jgi:hypothetical protein